MRASQARPHRAARDRSFNARLAAKPERDGVHPFLGDDFLDQLRGHGGKIDALGKPLARLDRRDVRVDQNGSDASSRSALIAWDRSIELAACPICSAPEPSTIARRGFLGR